MRSTLADSPKVGGQRSISCRKGQAPSLRGNGCEFVQSCGKHGRSCTERRGRRSLPGRMRIRRRWRLVFAVAARCALPRTNCEFAERLWKSRNCCGGVGTPPPTRLDARFPPFLPPAGEGGIRRSPARRMTEEGEPDRQQTAKSFAYARMRGKNSGSDLSSPLSRARTEQRGRHGLPPARG